MTEHDLSQRLEVGDDDRTVATAEVTTSAESGGTARASCTPSPGISRPAAARAWSTRCWTCPKCAAAPAWKWRSGWAIPSHCGGFRNAARRSPPIRPAGVRSSTGTFLPAAPAAAPPTQPPRTKPPRTLPRRNLPSDDRRGVSLRHFRNPRKMLVLPCSTDIP